jgi:hypothetical protein
MNCYTSKSQQSDCKDSGAHQSEDFDLNRTEHSGSGSLSDIGLAVDMARLMVKV